MKLPSTKKVSGKPVNLRETTTSNQRLAKGLVDPTDRAQPLVLESMLEGRAP